MPRGCIRIIKGNMYIKITDDNGNQTTRSVKKELGLTRAPKRSEAEKLLAKKLLELESTGIVYDSKILLKDFIIDWLDAKQNSIEFTTYDSYKMNIENHIIPHLGKIALNKLNKSTVQKFINTLSSKTGVRTVRYTAMILKQALDKAMAWELIVKNPADHLELPKETKREKIIWTDAQLLAFIESSATDRFYPFYLLAITTGMRRGEILALCWSDIDFSTGTIDITKSITAERIIKRPKSKSSVRKVNAPKFVLMLLEKLKIEQKQWYIASGIRPDNDAVFTTSLGTYFRPQNVLRAFQTACAKAEVPVIDLHSLRHLHVSVLLQEGVDLKTIQHRVGHAKLSTTLDVYSHLIDNTEQVASQKMEEHLNRLFS